MKLTLTLCMICFLAGSPVRSIHAAEGEASNFTSETIDIGVVVSDVPKAAKFYTEAIGFKEVKGFSVPSEWTRDVGLTEGKTLDIRVFVLGEGKSATKLKLMAAPGAGKDKTEYVSSQQGFRYLTIVVKDMDAAMARLKKAGANISTKGGMVKLPEGMPQHIYLTLVRDPDGNMIELVGPRSSSK